MSAPEDQQVRRISATNVNHVLLRDEGGQFRCSTGLTRKRLRVPPGEISWHTSISEPAVEPHDVGWRVGTRGWDETDSCAGCLRESPSTKSSRSGEPLSNGYQPPTTNPTTSRTIAPPASNLPAPARLSDPDHRGSPSSPS